MQNIPTVNDGIVQGCSRRIIFENVSISNCTILFYSRKRMSLSLLCIYCTANGGDANLGSYRHQNHRKHHHVLQNVQQGIGRRPREHFDVAALNVPGSESSRKDSLMTGGSDTGARGATIEASKHGAITVDLSTPILGMDR